MASLPLHHCHSSHGSSSYCSGGHNAFSLSCPYPQLSPSPRSGVILSQAQQFYGGNVILQKQASPCKIGDLPQPNDLFEKEARGKRSGNSRVHQLPERPSLLQAKDDCYDGVIVDPRSLPSDVDAFKVCLRASLSYWRSQNKRGVWLQLPTKNADFVPVAIQEGFQYHHAEPTHVMMTYWIPKTPSTLPPNASHQVGIGAFVLNEFREVLVVQEKNGPLRGSGVWKLPTGLIDQAEDIYAGAVREVKEETGVDTEFVQVVALRHGHYVAFNKSDLYFLCALRPLSLEIVEQYMEIEAAKWMPLEEFRSQPFYNESSMRKKMVDLCVASFNGQYEGFKPAVQSGSQTYPSHYFIHEGQ